ncbi:hypothetical protein PV04_10585 [Phialophora macrospora]|uniref:Uncharacterized protein n=1 Tax=Phialophora macrospora TaxID=1851006 RepID=A0A0D2DJ64_9EURO|nr:hypothetical protein PV04_10585 [Phialophora macrospora]
MLMPLRKRRRCDRQAGSRSGGSVSTSRGRPMKHASLLRPSRKAQTQQAELMHRQLHAGAPPPRANTLSTLESLPVEVFEQIFFHCLELNLPRASPYLAGALSRPAIYSALILFAYYESKSVLSQVEPEHFLPAAYRRITRDERVRLQDGILRCRWFTLELFESSLPALCRLTMFECWHRERRILETMFEQRLRQTEATIRLPEPACLLPALDDKLGMEGYYKARNSSCSMESQHVGPHGTSIGHETQAALSTGDSLEPFVGPVSKDGYLPFIVTATSRHEDGVPTSNEGRSILAVRAIPVQILRGAPWTDTKIKLLQYFRQGLRYESFERTLFISPEALFDGMASAIAEENENALLVLLELYATVVKNPAPIHKVELHEEAINPPVNILPLRLFHLVCELEASTRIMSLLLRSGVESIPYDDKVLTRWAMHIKAESLSDEEITMARWLLGYMEDIKSANASHVYPDPAGLTFTNEIGYICLGSPTSSPWAINPTNAPDDE